MDEIIRYYERTAEADRLLTGSGLLERERNREIIGRYLPPAPAPVADIGGGPGAYAGWLASLGYHVHLLDPVPKHCAAAAKLGLAGVTLGDARALPWATGFASQALLLGPLYHLVERTHRLLALREAARVVRPGGFVVAAAISRWAGLLHSLVDGFVDHEPFWPVLGRQLAAGLHTNDTGIDKYFTTAVLHKPSELKAEMEEAGLAGVTVAGVEGPGWLAKDFDARWAGPDRRDRLLHLVRSVENEPELTAVSLHLLGVGKVSGFAADKNGKV